MELKIGQIFNDRFKILKEIGIGGFSRVLLVSDTQNGNKEVALKLFADTTGLDTQTITEVKAEFSKVRGKSHPNILAPYEFGQIENVPYLVMDYADGGNLRHHFGELLNWHEEEKLSMIKQVLSGLSYLHENSIIHHDLKPENIVIHNGEYKIIDFGLSEKTKSSIKSSVKTASKHQHERITGKQIPDTTDNVSSGYTEQYVSPEKVYAPLRVTSKSDIFSLGIILFEMFEGVSPWNGQGGVVYGKTEKLPEFDNKDKYTSNTYKLIKSCLAYKPEQRPSAEQILKHLEKPDTNSKKTWIYGLVGMIAVIAVGMGIIFGVGNEEPIVTKKEPLIIKGQLLEWEELKLKDEVSNMMKQYIDIKFRNDSNELDSNSINKLFDMNLQTYLTIRESLVKNNLNNEIVFELVPKEDNVIINSLLIFGGNFSIYDKQDEANWNDYSRLKNAELIINDTLKYSFEFEDIQSPQYFKIEPLHVTENLKIKLRFLDVFPGVSSELNISDIIFNYKKDINDLNDGQFFDIRDGQRYNWKRFGEQIWMTEDFNYSYEDNKKSWKEKENVSRFYDIYDYNSKVFRSTASSKGIISLVPSGWAVPSVENYKELFNHISGEELPYFYDKDSFMNYNSATNNKRLLDQLSSREKYGFNLNGRLSLEDLFFGKGIKDFRKYGYYLTSDSIYYLNYCIKYQPNKLIGFYGMQSGLSAVNIRLIYNINEEIHGSSSVLKEKNEKSSAPTKDIPTVKIGNQIWMQENLDVSHYRNGDPILHAKTDKDWNDAGEKGIGAWCYYDNKPENGKIYGKLYNWYAVNDMRGLAPEGWRVPSDNDWKELEKKLGMTNAELNEFEYTKRGRNLGSMLAGDASKWQMGLLVQNNSFNTTNFKALPSGSRYHNSATFVEISEKSILWTSSRHLENYAITRIMINSNSGLFRSFNYYGWGFAVRCVKD